MMSNNKIWFWEAKPEEQGDFSDINSRHTYQSGNITDAVQAEAEAIDRGEEAIWFDAPIDQNEAYEVQSGQQFNRWESSDDSQGVEYQRRK